jgi:hypothetical protein
VEQNNQGLEIYFSQIYVAVMTSQHNRRKGARAMAASRRRGLDRMEPAYSLVRALGGPTAVAKEVGILQPNCSLWSSPVRESGIGGNGRGGIIPHRHYETLVAMAKRLDVPVIFDHRGVLCLDVEAYRKKQDRKAKGRK